MEGIATRNLMIKIFHWHSVLTITLKVESFVGKTSERTNFYERPWSILSFEGINFRKFTALQKIFFEIHK